MLIDKTINEPSEELAQVGAVIADIMAQKTAEKEAEELLLAQSLGLRKPPKQRAGITKNKGRGASKAARKMAAKSRRINRKAA